MSEKHYAFFQNRECEYFPCHKGVAEEDFNCLFCYCPLYALGEKCGGGFVYRENGVKSCENCSYPHRREHYEAIVKRYGELAALAARREPTGTDPAQSVRRGQKLLRCGYTTGSCAAAAAAGAARLLLTGRAPETVELQTPKGVRLTLRMEDCSREEDWARCAVQKDAGDDPDVTDGLRIYATVERAASGISIDGGAGVGRVTKPGLDQPVGEAAINSVPRRMIAEAVAAVLEELDYEGGLRVVISAPGGEKIAQNTFNPMLGIRGGISILGTSGIVEPMSEQALVDTIALEIRQAAAQGAKCLILTPGNYGKEYLGREYRELETLPVVKCSNFIGEALDEAVLDGFSEILLVGHVGKLVKLAGGIFNTHSRTADCRAELFCAHAALAGGDKTLCRALMDCSTTDACLARLDEAGLRDPVMAGLLGAMREHLSRRAGETCAVGAVLFSNEYGLLGETPEAKEIMERWN